MADVARRITHVEWSGQAGSTDVTLQAMEPTCASGTLDPLTGMCETAASAAPVFDELYEMNVTCAAGSSDAMWSFGRVCTAVSCPAMQICQATPGNHRDC